jgi:hypothetical protein
MGRRSPRSWPLPGSGRRLSLLPEQRRRRRAGPRGDRLRGSADQPRQLLLARSNAFCPRRRGAVGWVGSPVRPINWPAGGELASATAGDRRLAVGMALVHRAFAAAGCGRRLPGWTETAREPGDRAGGATMQSRRQVRSIPSIEPSVSSESCSRCSGARFGAGGCRSPGRPTPPQRRSARPATRRAGGLGEATPRQGNWLGSRTRSRTRSRTDCEVGESC